MTMQDLCHCGLAVYTDDSGFSRDMCEDCSLYRCDIEPGCVKLKQPEHDCIMDDNVGCAACIAEGLPEASSVGCVKHAEHEYAPGTRFVVVEIPPEVSNEEADMITAELFLAAAVIDEAHTGPWDLFIYRQHNAPPANVPAASQSLREALEKRLETMPVMRHENDYPVQALPKADLLSLLAMHPAEEKS